MEELDNLIFDEIRKLTIEPIETTPEPTPDNSKYEKKLNDIDKQISRLMDLYAIGDMPLNVIKEKIDVLNDQRNKIENTLNQPKHMTKQDAVEMLTSFDEILESGDLETIHDLIGALIERIEIDGEDITIKWNFL